MDYSAEPHDAEHLAGPSPWASSPQQNKPGFVNQNLTNDNTGTAIPPESPMFPRPIHSRDDSLETSTADLSSNSATNGGLEVQSSSYEERERQQQPPRDQDEGSAQTQPEQQDSSRAQSQRYQGNRTASKQTPTQRKLQAKVMGLERTGRKDPILRFDIYTNLPSFRTTQFRDVRRTHSEFQKLADHLVSSSPEAFVPALPPPQTSAGVGTDEDETRVKQSMQRWLNVVCSNDVLMRDEEVVRFVEGDPGYSPVVRKSQPATGVRRKMIKQFAPPPDDTPELQDARPVVKLFYLGTMDAGQKVDKVVKVRRGLGLAEVDFGAKLGAMSEQEGHPGLKNAYRKLGRIVQTEGDFHAAQGTAEATVFGDPLQYHSADAFIVKETLTNRHILLRELAQAQAATNSKLQATDRLKASSSVRRDKVDEAIFSLDEARSNESYLQQKTQRVTANLVQERRKWFMRTATDLRANLREYVIREIEAERRTLAILESVRPDIRAIDASGGLSRLGREAHPAARRASLMSSQGPKGDAWSGVARRQDGLNRSISGTFVAPTPVEEEEEDEEEAGMQAVGGSTGKSGTRQRAMSGAGSLASVQEDDDDKVDARNAASRLAASTF